MWTDLWAALALVMVLEGVLPFLNPAAVRRMLEAVSRVDDHSMRISGLVSMMAGLGLLYMVR
jgi:uncharacterized protein